jgi:hypothetical protein
LVPQFVARIVAALVFAWTVFDVAIIGAITVPLALSLLWGLS